MNNLDTIIRAWDKLEVDLYRMAHLIENERIADDIGGARVDMNIAMHKLKAYLGHKAHAEAKARRHSKA